MSQELRELQKRVKQLERAFDRMGKVILSMPEREQMTSERMVETTLLMLEREKATSDILDRLLKRDKAETKDATKSYLA